MNKEIKEEWLKALRSGEYMQGVIALKHENKFCCLGVLCELYIREMKEAYCDWKDGDNFHGDLSLFGSAYFLPGAVQDWAGLNSENVWIDSLGRSLADLNDDGKTFEEIAQVIEREL